VRERFQSEMKLHRFVSKSRLHRFFHAEGNQDLEQLFLSFLEEGLCLRQHIYTT
jgi:hypothetical protein